MATQTIKGVGIVRLKNQNGEDRGLLAFPASGLNMPLNLERMTMLEGSDAEIGAAVRGFFAPAETTTETQEG